MMRIGEAMQRKRTKNTNVLQFIQLQIKYKELDCVMSISMQSDEETIGESSFTNIQTLIKENKIKDLALSKATNLIQLLSVELQVERNSKQQALRQVEQQLRLQFSKELEGMKQKIEFLERELKRCNAMAINSTNAKTKRQTSLSRSDSSISLEGKRRNTINKRQTEINHQEGILDKQSKIQIAYLQDHFLNIEEWKQMMIDDLNGIVNSDYLQLQDLLIKLEARYTELQEIFNEPVNPYVTLLFDDFKMENNHLREIVNQQKTIINQLKMHIQDIEDIFKHVIFKMANFSKSTDENSSSSSINMHDIVLDIKLSISQGKKQWIKKLSNLEDENIQLKNILDNIIMLVQNEKRIKY